MNEITERTGYLYTHEGAVYIADAKQPEPKEFLAEHGSSWYLVEFDKAIATWERKLKEKPVKNVKLNDEQGTQRILIDDFNEMWLEITDQEGIPFLPEKIESGHPCHYIVSDGEYLVTQIT